MYKIRSSLLGFFAVAMISQTSPALADDPAPLDDAAARKVDAILAKADPKLMEVLVTRRDDEGAPTFETVKTPTLAKARAVVSQLLGKPDVVAVEMNRTVKAAGINDPLFKYQWALNSSHLDVVRLRQITSRDTRHPLVAVVDTGVWRYHPDLKGRVTTGFNAFSGATGTTYDGDGHGTHVAGIIAAKTNNRGGIAGLSRTAIIVPVKVLNSDGAGSLATVARGITWAASHSNVINLSLGWYGYSEAANVAVQTARSRGRVVIAAVGNDGTYSTFYPASYSGVLGVGAHNSGYGVASFSNRGSQVDLVAPGTSIISTMVPWSSGSCYDYCKLQGTSMAAPHISALAAMSMAHCGYKANTVIDRIQRWSAYWPDRDPYDPDGGGYGPVLAASFLNGCRTWPLTATVNSAAAAGDKSLPEGARRDPS